MQKLLIKFILLFLLVVNGISQNNFTNHIYNKDSSFTVFDNFYLYQNINKQEVIIADLNSKINNYQIKCSNSAQQIKSLTNKINIYSNVYENSLESFYYLKTNISSSILFFMSSKSFNTMYFRFNFLKLLISYIHLLHDYLISLIQEQNTNIDLLKNYKATLSTYLIKIQNEQISYDSNFLILLKQTAVLQQKSNQIRISINNTYQGYSMIETSIKNIKTDPISNDKFEFSISCLPLDNPVIISSFGVHDHPYLKNIKIRNDGIDLFSSSDTLPKNVSNGIVSEILKIPNLGYSVIIKHDNFFSVYSNLNSVFVKKNEKLKYGIVIGSISKKSSKYKFPCLNFQIWKQTEKLNPNLFLNLN